MPFRNIMDGEPPRVTIASSVPGPRAWTLPQVTVVATQEGLEALTRRIEELERCTEILERRLAVAEVPEL